jgi:hypothetical protein
MNTWNTFRDESFTYPNLCAKCAAPEPSATWELKYSEIEFPEGMPVSPYDQKPRNYNAFLTQVPVCQTCLASLRRRGRICWLLGAVVGAVSACFLLGYLQNLGGISPRGSVSTTVAAGIFVSLVAGYLLKMIFVDTLSFAKYNGREQKLQFQNKEFQAQYDRLNFNYSPTTGQYAGAKGW